jgi:predicted aminopeptidase
MYCRAQGYVDLVINVETTLCFLVRGCVVTKGYRIYLP